MSLRNNDDDQYIGEIVLGAEKISMHVVFDTGSSDLWLPRSRYQPELSSTSRCPAGGCSQHAEVDYSQGSVSGDIRVDEVRIGKSIIGSQAFLLAESIKGLDNRLFDGVLGLAFPALSHTGTTVLEQLVAQANISCFSFLISGEQESSWFVIGEPPASWYIAGSLVRAPVKWKEWWTFEAAMAAGSTLLLENSLFALDTGTSFLAVPTSAFQTLVTSLLNENGAKMCQMDSALRSFVCPCKVKNTMQILYLLLNGQEFPVYPEDLLTIMNPMTDSCLLEVQTTSENMPWILGDTFLRAVAPLFDITGGEIGLARRQGYVPRLQSTRDRAEADRGVVRGAPLLKPHMPTPTNYTMYYWVGLPLAILVGGAIGAGLGTCLDKALLLRRPRVVAPAAAPAPSQPADVAPQEGAAPGDLREPLL